jgi:putative protease
MVKENVKKPELISPAGDMEKLKIAFMYGADAVYASTPIFSMRTREIGFNQKTLKEGIDYAHSIGKKVYLTINTFPHPSQIEALKKHILSSAKLGPDAFIVADPGVLEFVKANTTIPIHLSTQANTTNHLSAEFWQKQGVERIVLARELSLKDIKAISDYCSSEARTKTGRLLGKASKNNSLELEAFIHGAMCMAYSGRCQISNYLTRRDPNKGACIQACRFKYKMYGLEEEFRPGEIFPLYEDEEGTHILNSKDLCMIDHIPDMIEAGISSFKIEGRLKSIYYVGIITRAYRKAIDLYFADSEKYKKERKKLALEIAKTSNRGFTTGFFFNKPDKDTNNYETSRAKSSWGFVGIVKSYDKAREVAVIEAKNRLLKGSEIEIVTPDQRVKCKIVSMMCKGNEVDVVHAGYEFEMPLGTEVPESSFVRLRLR